MRRAVCILVVLAPALVAASQQEWSYIGSERYDGQHPHESVVTDLAKVHRQHSRARVAKAGAAGSLVVEEFPGQPKLEEVVRSFFVQKDARTSLLQSDWHNQLSEECRHSPIWTPELSDARLLYTLHTQDCLAHLTPRQNAADPNDVQECAECGHDYAAKCSAEGAQVCSLTASFTESVNGVTSPYGFRMYQCMPPECDNTEDRNVIKSGPVEALEQFLGPEDNNVQIAINCGVDPDTVGSSDEEDICNDVRPTQECLDAFQDVLEDPIMQPAVFNYQSHRCDMVAYHNQQIENNIVVYCDNGAKEYQNACMMTADDQGPRHFCEFSAVFDTNPSTTASTHWNITSFVCLPDECNDPMNRLWFDVRAKKRAAANFNLEDSETDVDVVSTCGAFQFLSDQCVEAELARDNPQPTSDNGDEGNDSDADGGDDSAEDEADLREIETEYRDKAMECFSDALNSPDEMVSVECAEMLDDYRDACADHDEAIMCTIGTTFDEEIGEVAHHFAITRYQCVLRQCANAADRAVLEYQNEYTLEAVFGEEENNVDVTWHCPTDQAQGSGSMSTGAKVGIAVGGAAGLLALGGVAFLCVRRNKMRPRRPKGRHQQLGDEDDEPSRFSKVQEQELSVNSNASGRVLLRDDEDPSAPPLRGPPAPAHEQL